MGKISYDSGQHQALQSELTKIGEGFKNLIIELKAVNTASSSHLKGEAATSLESAIDDLTQKLTASQSNWSTTISNAKQVEQLIKEADEKSAKKIG